MGLILKTTLKNILGNPLRTVLVVFAIFACSFAAMLCFDLTSTGRTLISDLLSGVLGDSDIIASGKNFDPEKIPEDMPEYRIAKMRQLNEIIYEDIEGEYYLATNETAVIYSFNIEDAEAIGIISDVEVGDNEIVITEPYASALNVGIGDTITIHDIMRSPVEVTVRGIAQTDSLSMVYAGLSGIVNETTGDELMCGVDTLSMYLIDVADDSRTSEAYDKLNEAMPYAEYENIRDNDAINQTINQLVGIMFLVFAITFLLVIFITASICERIVSERMSYVGTLRSLGMSPHQTIVILLIENVFYALAGSLPAVLFYTYTRVVALGASISSTAADDLQFTLNIPPMPSYLGWCVVLGAVLIECIIPMKAELKAMRTSIRDIIFDNRDTAYKFSAFGIVLGFVFLAGAIVTFFMRKEIVLLGICLICSVIALAFLFPLILKGVTDIIKKLSGRANNVKWMLASIESGTRKSSVGSGVLAVTSAAMCVIVFSVALSLISFFTNDSFKCDVVVETSKNSEYFSYVKHLEGVTDWEYVYSMSDHVLIDDEDMSSKFYSVPAEGYTMYEGFADVPENLVPGTIAIENSWAASHGYSVGDSIHMVIDPDGVFPIDKTFTIAGFFSSKEFSTTNNNFLLTEDDFLAIFHDQPQYLLIMTDNPQETADLISKYGVGSYKTVKTAEQLAEEKTTSGQQIRGLFLSVIIVAVAMSAIGMISNQLIGFDGRKKQCAVLLSTAMDKRTLSGILFDEMLITALTSVTTGALIGSVLLLIIRDTLRNSTLTMQVKFDPLMILALWAGMSLVFALTVLFPLRNLKKMKIAEQIKYE